MKTKIVSLKKLREEREKTGIMARRNALSRALIFYFPALVGFEPEKNLVESLKQALFTTWLQEHTSKEQFSTLTIHAMN